MVYLNGQAFDHKIRRSAVRDGLNLISISPSMVMAGTGEISCLRRLRFAYGMYHQMMYYPDFKYGIHVAAHMSLGLRFLGGGRFTPPLPVRSRPSSPAPITCLPIIKFPSSATPSAGPRHQATVFARDMETTEVVYDGKEPFHSDTANIPRHKDLTLFRYRMMALNSRYFHMHLQDLRFAADFYSKIYDRRFSGRRENNFRTSLIRDSTISGALYGLDKQLDLAYMLMLSSVLVDESSPLHVRNAAGLALKKTLTVRESGRSRECANRWMNLSTEAKIKIKNDALLT
ncbi:hypothetical protein B0H13DRAFT_2533548 [Mycena leptocephala]|nr:hypothetical protein B0H13DRAFT_2533548 [Mycena leptocephala]